MRPPLHLVDFVEVDLEGLGAVGSGFEGPCAVVDEDRVGEVALSRCKSVSRVLTAGKSVEGMLYVH